MPKIPDWEVIMNTERTGYARRRFFSINCLATITGRDDLEAIVSEMKASGKVACAYCTVIKVPVFFIQKLYPEYRNESWTWDTVSDFIKMYPYPNVKGFKEASGLWSSGIYGVGQFIVKVNSMADPFVEEDFPYANTIIKAMKEAGYISPIELYKE